MLKTKIVLFPVDIGRYIYSCHFTAHHAAKLTTRLLLRSKQVVLYAYVQYLLAGLFEATSSVHCVLS